MSKTYLFNPYTGKPRHPSDIASDPEGLLIVEPGAPVVPAGGFTNAEMAKAVSGLAAVAEHDAKVYEKSGGSLEIMHRHASYARKLRAAADLLKKL